VSAFHPFQTLALVSENDPLRTLEREALPSLAKLVRWGAKRNDIDTQSLLTFSYGANEILVAFSHVQVSFARISMASLHCSCSLFRGPTAEIDMIAFLHAAPSKPLLSARRSAAPIRN
jgi:hypothetical protein